MNKKRLLILGGYGNTGLLLSRLLVQETDAQLVLGGRRIERAKSAALELNESCGEDRVSAIAVDASNPADLRRAFQGVDLVVVASSTAKFARQVACAALEAGADYYDIQYSTQKIVELKSLAQQIEQAGRCFITDGGFHPGLPAVLVRYAAQRFERLDRAVVGSVIKEDWARYQLPDETIIELVEEFKDYAPMVFKQGRWQKGGFFSMLSVQSMDFGDVFRRQYCAAMFLEELHAIPEWYPSLQEIGFYVGGFNWFVDWLILPLVMVFPKIWPEKATRRMAKWMRWGLETFSKPPYATILKLEASGLAQGVPAALEVTLSHQDGYLLTAMPVAACLLQYLDGSIPKPGLWMQAHLAEPDRLIEDMQRMGLEVRVDWRSE